MGSFSATLFWHFIEDDGGALAIEEALMWCLITLFTLSSITAMANAVADRFLSCADLINTGLNP